MRNRLLIAFIHVYAHRLPVSIAVLAASAAALLLWR